jgi:urocanate reductase
MFDLTSSRRQFVKGAAGATAAVALAAMPGLAHASESADAGTASTEASSSVTDGTYVGSAQGKHDVVEVTVTVTDGKIADVEITKCNDTDGLAESVINRLPQLVVDTQSLNYDNVTGATVTSAAFTTALEDALTQAGFDVSALEKADKAEVTYEDPASTDADVIVLGAGGAGMCAALTAANEGKSVIIIEKMPSIGGNTMLSGGGMAAPCNWLQEEEGIEDSPELFESDVIAGGDEKGDPDLIHVLAQGALDSAVWLRDEHGVEWSDHLVFFGGHSVKRSVVPEGESGAKITTPLENDCKDAGIEIVTDMRATEFVMDDDGTTVKAVKATRTDGEEFEFTGKAFVLATGGFGSNVEMRMQYDSTLDENIKSTDSVGTTGDGVTMAQNIGAAFTGMEYIQTYPTCDPITGALLYLYDMRLYDRGILVNKEGDRFVEELDRRDVISNAIKSQTDNCAWLLWDEAGVEETQLIANHQGEYDMGIANGVVVKGDTLEEVAEAAGIDAEEFVKTVEHWNEMCDAGTDTDFNYRSTMNKFETAPYYLGRCVPSVHHTMGGVHCTTDAQMQKEDGTLFTNLFAAGEVTGGIHGTNRLGSDAIADVAVFGRVAGSSASGAC